MLNVCVSSVWCILLFAFVISIDMIFLKQTTTHNVLAHLQRYAKKHNAQKKE